MRRRMQGASDRRTFGASLLWLILLITVAAPGWTQGTLWAWGDNTQGQLGIGSMTQQATPVKVANSTNSGHFKTAVAASATKYQSLFLESNGTVWAVGDNTWGELGNNTTTASDLPVQVFAHGSMGSTFLSNITQVAAGFGFSLALDKNGAVWAWGWDNHGQLGTGLTDYNAGQALTPNQVTGSGGVGYIGTVVSIAAGDNHSLAALKGGTVWAWGDNSVGELGIGTTDASAHDTPVQVKSQSGYLVNIVAVGAGNNYSLALDSSGHLWAWGDNSAGELGIGTVGGSQSKAVEVVAVGQTSGGTPLSGVTAFSTGDLHCLALLNTGQVVAWGSDTAGELGDDTNNNSGSPLRVKDPTDPSGYLTGVVSVSAGYSFSLASKIDGNAYGWGDNYNGELGLGAADALAHPYPQQVTGATGFVNLVAAKSGYYVLGLTGYALLWQNTQTGDVVGWLMSFGLSNTISTTRVASDTITSNVPTAWKIVGSGAFSTGRTTRDILLQNTSTGEIGYWQMNGGEYVDYVQIAKPGVVPTVWHIVGAGKFNTSPTNQNNILFQNVSTGEIGYWTLNNNAYYSYTQISAPGVVPTSWQIVDVDYFTPVDYPNILFQNTSTGEIGYWTLSNNHYSSYTQIVKPGQIATNWHLVYGSGGVDNLGLPGIITIFQNVSTGEVGDWYFPGDGTMDYMQISAPGVVPTAWALRGIFL